MRARRPVELPSPGVRFGPDFLTRLGRLEARLASLRERSEGQGVARLFGVGAEFVGYRPYRSGEDLRSLDWNLYARLRRPYVRVAAREASEEWAVLLDTSASMGVGRPGKLQLAAEVATAIAALALLRRASVELWTSNGAPRCTLARRTELRVWMAQLERTRAQGEQGLGSLVAEFARRRGAGRAFLIGDFLDAEPRQVFGAVRPACELVLTRILAAEELRTEEHGSVRWVDAESGRSRTLAVDPAARAGYEGRLEANLERWSSAARRARALHGVWTSDTPFETVLQEMRG